MSENCVRPHIRMKGHEVDDAQVGHNRTSTASPSTCLRTWGHHAESFIHLVPVSH
jgi:hypothetical protein